MKQIYLLFFFLVTPFFLFSQIVINELDCDTPGIDDKEFLELKSDTPNFPLDGYVVVFFNGSTSGANKSYMALDLDGYVTDVNGLLLIGSVKVYPYPQYIIAENLIQNGVDAVAIYKANDLDFEEPKTAYVDETLIDVLLYRTTQTDGTGLIPIFSAFNPNIQIISEGSGNNTNSIQRNNDGSYTVKVPTPRQLNDGTGIILNGLGISIGKLEYNEGDTFDITFTTEQNVTSELNFEILLSNDSFTTLDYTGNTTLKIPAGQKTTSTSITLVDDSYDEGDEEMKIRFVNLPTEYLILNNNLKIRVVDNDFVVSNWGTPINPTRGNVQSTQPAGYYDSLDGLSGAGLRQGIQNIIANPSIVRAQTYADIVDMLKEADQNPENSNQVWLVYLEIGRAKLDYQTTSSSVGKWNREHTFPRARAGYNSIKADDIADGINVYWTTNADSLRHGNSDGHGLRAADGPENSSRNDQYYGEGQYVGPIGTLGGFKGDVARSIFYMAVRYNGLEIVNGYPYIVGQFGDLATLLEWHRNDPPDDYEMNRNNKIYNWQMNRNPFIDQPEMVEYIWGNKIGSVWNQSLEASEIPESKILMYPNPTKNLLNITGIEHETKIEIFSTDGRLLDSKFTLSNTQIDLNLQNGIYLVKLTSNGKVIVEKIIIE